jgi:hypothetical protein
MIDAHGADFATGAFVLAARWIAEGRMKRGEPVAAGVSGTSSTGDAARRRAGPSASASDRQ